MFTLTFVLQINRKKGPNPAEIQRFSLQNKSLKCREGNPNMKLNMQAMLGRYVPKLLQVLNSLSGPHCCNFLKN